MGGGNYRMAAARYNKALTHAAKFLDLSPDQKEEVESTKLSLHLNIAMCWLKITDAENHLDQKSLKALFRRATAREAKGDYEGATADLKMFASIDPEDAAMLKLTARVEAQIKRQEAKEKKMYSKMFG